MIEILGLSLVILLIQLGFIDWLDDRLARWQHKREQARETEPRSYYDTF